MTDEKWPSFAEAEIRFRRFLESLGHPREIHWVFPQDALLFGSTLYLRLCPESEAREVVRREYEEVREEGLAVELSSVAYGTTQTFAFIFRPRNREEANRQMMDEGVKLSAVKQGPRCRVVHRDIVWRLLKNLSRSRRADVEFLFHLNFCKIRRGPNEL